MLSLLLVTQVQAGALTEAPTTEATQDPAGIVQAGGKIEGGFALAVGETSIAAAYLPQRLGGLRGAVLILHDQSAQIDGPLIHQLREDLTLYGWDTLAISLNHQIQQQTDTSAEVVDTEPTSGDVSESAAPDENSVTDTPADLASDQEGQPTDNNDVKAASALQVPSNAERMDAALAWLQAKNPPSVVIIGHGLGVETAIDTLMAKPQQLKALVIISADEAVTSERLLATRVPVLDIMGSQVNQSLKQAAVTRLSNLRLTSNDLYSQRIVSAADRDFTGIENTLGKQIHSWLYRRLIAN